MSYMIRSKGGRSTPRSNNLRDQAEEKMFEAMNKKYNPKPKLINRVDAYIKYITQMDELFNVLIGDLRSRLENA